MTGHFSVIMTMISFLIYGILYVSLFLTIGTVSADIFEAVRNDSADDIKAALDLGEDINQVGVMMMCRVAVSNWAHQAFPASS